MGWGTRMGTPESALDSVDSRDLQQIGRLESMLVVEYLVLYA